MRDHTASQPVVTGIYLVCLRRLSGSVFPYLFSETVLLGNAYRIRCFDEFLDARCFH